MSGPWSARIDEAVAQRDTLAAEVEQLRAENYRLGKWQESRIRDAVAEKAAEVEQLRERNQRLEAELAAMREHIEQEGLTPRLAALDAEEHGDKEVIEDASTAYDREFFWKNR